MSTDPVPLRARGDRLRVRLNAVDDKRALDLNGLSWVSDEMAFLFTVLAMEGIIQESQRPPGWDRPPSATNTEEDAERRDAFLRGLYEMSRGIQIAELSYQSPLQLVLIVSSISGAFGVSIGVAHKVLDVLDHWSQTRRKLSETKLQVARDRRDDELETLATQIVNERLTSALGEFDEERRKLVRPFRNVATRALLDIQSVDQEH